MTGLPARIGTRSSEPLACGQCGAQTPDDGLICSVCGKDPSFLPHYRCPSCGGLVTRVRRRLLPVSDLVLSWLLVTGALGGAFFWPWAAAVVAVAASLVVVGRRRLFSEARCLSCDGAPAGGDRVPRWETDPRIDGATRNFGLGILVLIVATQIVVPAQLARIRASSEAPSPGAEPGETRPRPVSAPAVPAESPPPSSREQGSVARSSAAKRGRQPASAAKSLCGDLDAELMGPTPQSWERHTCMTQATAGIRWTSCLPRADYAREGGAGCPGDQRCCPPW